MSRRHRNNRNNKKPSITSSTKKQKTNKTEKISNYEDDVCNWSEWVSATSTKNYILNDGILDYFKTIKNGSNQVGTKPETRQKRAKKTSEITNNFETSILNQGINFENKVIELIIEKLGQEKVINIGGDDDARSYSGYLKTIESMKEGIPVIYQGIVRNYKNKSYGVTDLLIRSDYLEKIYETTPLNKKQSMVSAQKLGGKESKSKTVLKKSTPKTLVRRSERISKISTRIVKRRTKNRENKRKLKNMVKKSKQPGFHYVVIDVKFKTLELNSDGIHLRNNGIMKAYKGQLYVYNQALGSMQGYTPSCAYIMGWKWKYVKNTIKFSGNSCFDKLGSINYKDKDVFYVGKTEDAIEWVNKVRQNSHLWNLNKLPFPHKELYPNMCNKYDYPYHNLKQKLAESIYDPTMIWKCTTAHRQNLHSKGVYSWRDPKCTVESLGIGGEYTKKIVSRVLEANQGHQKIIPKYIINNFENWQTEQPLELFVDFEMTCNVFTEFNNLYNSDSKSLIFTIGVGYYDKNNSWIFRDFTVDRLSEDQEFLICGDFVNYVEGLMEEYGYDSEYVDYPKMYHWSHAEPSAWKRVMERYLPASYNWDCLNWVDMLKVFQKEPIGIKGCLNYGLKSIAKQFYKNGYIKTTWDSSSSCADGADAAVGAYNINKRTMISGMDFSSDMLAKEIIKYNEIDCKVLGEIIGYLRNNHIDENIVFGMDMGQGFDEADSDFNCDESDSEDISEYSPNYVGFDSEFGSDSFERDTAVSSDDDDSSYTP